MSMRRKPRQSLLNQAQPGTFARPLPMRDVPNALSYRDAIDAARDDPRWETDLEFRQQVRDTYRYLWGEEPYVEEVNIAPKSRPFWCEDDE